MASDRDTGSHPDTGWLCVHGCMAEPLWASVFSPDKDRIPSPSLLPTRLPPHHLSQASSSGKLSTRRKERLRNRSSLVAERKLDEELQSSFSAWLRLPRLLDGDTSTSWLGRTTCFRFSCRDGLEEPSASGWGGRRENEGLVHVCDHQEESG